MGLLAQKLGAQVAPRAAVASVRSKTRTTLRQRMARGEVEWSPDLQRVLELPRRKRPELEPIVAQLTQRLKKPGGTQTLREIQAWALHEAPNVGGLIVLAQTGAGKSLIGMLAPMVFPPIINPDGTWRPLRAVMFVPPSLKPQFLAEWQQVYSKHWVLPNLAGGQWFTPGLPTVHVVAYSELSQTNRSALLHEIKPDLVMGDEISSLSNFETARNRRMRSFMESAEDAKFIGMDGSLVSDTVEDLWAPTVWALDERAPMPIEQSETKRWARALDPKSYDDGYYLPGQLMRFCEAGEPVRSGFQRRLSETSGVIMTRENTLGIPLYLIERHPPEMPEIIREDLKKLRKKPADGGWKRPDGEEFQDEAQVAACKRQLAEGMYLYWFFPRGEPDEVIDAWFLRRQSWNREVRAQLFHPRMHMDTPKLCENAAERWFIGGCPGCKRGPQQHHEVHCREKDTHPLWDSQCFLEWRRVEDTVEHETRVKWQSDWLLRDAGAWAFEKPGIVWVDHPEFGHELSKMTGLRYYGGGDKANEEIALEFSEGRGRSSKSIICSVMANFKGKNLQHAFNRNLVISFPTSNKISEQLIGRTYREGQSSDRVEVYYYEHTPELENSIDNARSEAKFVWETLGNDQKLRFGEFVSEKKLFDEILKATDE